MVSYWPCSLADLVALLPVAAAVAAAAAKWPFAVVAVSFLATSGAAVTAEAEPWWAYFLPLLHPEVCSSLAGLPGSH